MSPAEVAAALEAAGATTSPSLTKGPSRVIADLLAYQTRLGKVVKVRPALFAAVPGRISRSTRQRCLGWRRQFEELVADYEAWEAGHPESTERPLCPGPPLSDVGAEGPQSTPSYVCPGPPLSDAHDHGQETSERGGLGERTAIAPDGGAATKPMSAKGFAGGYPSAMFTVEAATADDLDVLVEQGAALFREDAGTYDAFIDFTWSEREGRADFERLIASGDCLALVARDGANVIGHLVGYTHAASPTRLPVTYANLRSLFVEPSHRRRGVGDQLTRDFIDWARAKGCAEAHVDSYARNEPAQRLYERHGFVVRSTARALPL